MPFPYLGTVVLTYPQYRDALTGRPLVAVPGNSYQPEPVAGADGMAVPPADQLWGSEEPATGENDAAEPADEPKTAPKTKTAPAAKEN